MNDIVCHPNDQILANGGVPEPNHPSGFRLQRLSPYMKELAYQTVIVFVLLIFFSFSWEESGQESIQTLFEPSRLMFFANYLAAAMVINYILLPVLYYRKRFLLFFAAIAALLAVVILVDEYVLEQIFYPDTRGTYFPGLVFTLVETLPIIIIIVAFKLAWDSNRKQHELERLKGLMKESEIQYLKSQINPHFLFNNLNNLYAHAIDHSPQTPSIILELSAVLRYMLYECRSDLVALKTEIQHLENYLASNRLQLGGRGAIRFTKEISGMPYAIPPLILIVFVENAFKHSTGSQAAAISIEVGVQVSDAGEMTFICRNNYSPHHPVAGKASGIGLENVRKRLALHYPGNHALTIRAEENIFTVELKMQLKERSL